MLDENFYGKRPYVWWTGVVEDILDPLKMGRLKIRIFGLHPKEKDLLPTEKLPWAQAVHPITGAKVACSPRFGDWVLGFFLDGEAGQMPVVTGVFSGIDEVQANVAGKDYVPPPNNFGFYDPRPKPQVEQGPRPPTHIEDRKVGEPAVQRRLPREILVGTGIRSTNAKLSKVCDITGYVNASIGVARGIFAKIGQAVRTAINAILSLLGLDLSGVTSFIVSELKRIAAIFRQIQRFLQDINYMISMVNYALNLINEFVRYVASLPARFAELVRSCLSQMINDIYSALGGAISGAIPTEIRQVFSAINETASAIYGTLNTATSVYQNAQQTVSNAQAVGQNIANLPQALANNTEGALNSLTTNISNQITVNNQVLTNQVVSSVFSLPPQIVEPQPISEG